MHATRGAAVAFGCFGLCTSNSHVHRRGPVPAGLHCLPGGQHTHDGPHSSCSQCLKSNQNVSVDRIAKVHSHIKWNIFLKEGMCAAIDSEFTNFHKFFLSTYYAPGTVLGTKDTVINKTFWVPELTYLYSNEIPVYIPVCCFQITYVLKDLQHNVLA